MREMQGTFVSDLFNHDPGYRLQRYPLVTGLEILTPSLSSKKL